MARKTRVPGTQVTRPTKGRWCMTYTKSLRRSLTRQIRRGGAFKLALNPAWEAGTAFGRLRCARHKARDLLLGPSMRGC